MRRGYLPRFFRNAASNMRRLVWTSVLKRATVSSDRASFCLAFTTTRAVPAARRRANDANCLLRISIGHLTKWQTVRIVLRTAAVFAELERGMIRERAVAGYGGPRRWGGNLVGPRSEWTVQGVDDRVA